MRLRLTSVCFVDAAAPLADLNFPLPGSPAGPAVLLKVYSGSVADSLKLNEVIEVVGVLSTDPALSQISGEDELVKYV